MNQQIAQWYEQQTGLNAARGEQRINNIEAFLQAHGVTLNDVEIYTRNINDKYTYRPLAARPDRVKIGSTSHTSKKGTEYYVQIKR